MENAIRNGARRGFALACAFAAMFLAAPVVAAMVDVDVVPDGRGPVPLYRIAPRGQRTTYRSYVEAVRGDRYAVRVTNATGGRIGVVVAVDGRNVISGKKSDLRPDERMYVLPPYGSGTYEGWRTDLNTVNRFYFTDPGDAYAGAFGDFSAMGVIAVAVYREVPVAPPSPLTMERDAGKSASPGASAPAPQAGASRSAEARKTGESAGTGFGEETYSPAVKVDFRPEPRVAERHFVKYEWRDTLCRKGIVDCRWSKNRFWDDDGYAPYPPGRRRNGDD